MRSQSDRLRLVAACCGLMFAYGCFMGASQTVIESVASDLGLDIAGMGALVSLQFIPAAFVPVLVGALADRIGRKPLLAAFCALFCAGLVVCATAQSPVMYAIGAVMVGSGYSVCESGCCAVMSDLGPDWETRGINLSQAVLCLGAVLSPALIGFMRIPWRRTFFLCAGCYAVMLPILLALRFPAPRAAADHVRGGARRLLTSWVFLCLFAGILLYVGIESGFGYFIESLMSSRFDRVPLSCVSLYWLGMMVARFVFSSINYPAKTVLVAGYALIAALFAALIASTSAALSLALCFATGFAYGPIWSTLVAQANARYPEHAGVASGLMSAGCGAGGILFPALTGLVAGRFSLTAAFAMMGGVALTGAVLCALLPGVRQSSSHS